MSTLCELFPSGRLGRQRSVRDGIFRFRLTHHDLVFGATKPSGHNICCRRYVSPGPQGTFPHRRHPPPCFQEPRSDCAVSRDIRVKLYSPEAGARVWDGGEPAGIMAVPEAAMYKVSSTMLCHHDIRFADDTLRVQAISEAKSIQGPTRHQLRLRIPSPNSGHHARPGLAIYDVRNLPPGFDWWTWYTAIDLNSGDL